MRMLFRLLRIIHYVVANPHRSLAWKVVDVVFLTAVAAAVVVTVIETFFGQSSLAWFALYLLLLPWVVLVTQRSWYELPGAWKRRPGQAGPTTTREEGDGTIGTVVEAPRPAKSWDPLG